LGWIRRILIIEYNMNHILRWTGRVSRQYFRSVILRVHIHFCASIQRCSPNDLSIYRKTNIIFVPIIHFYIICVYRFTVYFSHTLIKLYSVFHEYISTCWHRPSSARYRIVKTETNDRLSWQPVSKTQDAKNNNNNNNISNNNRTLVWHTGGEGVRVCVNIISLTFRRKRSWTRPNTHTHYHPLQRTQVTSAAVLSKSVCQLLAPNHTKS